MKTPRRDWGRWKPSERGSGIRSTSGVPLFPCSDTAYLLRYLRTAKFSQLRARQVLEAHLVSKGDFPQWLNDIDPRDSDFVRVCKTSFVVPLPKPDDKGRTMLLIRPGSFEPNSKKWNKDHIVRAVFGLAFYCLLEERTLVNGFVFVHDFSSFTPKLIPFMGLETIKNSSKLWQGKVPGRFKAFHYFNPGSFVETIIAILRPVLSQKFQERTHVYGKNLEEMYKVIPMEYLPEEYLPDDYSGPHQGKIQDIIDRILTEIQTDRVRDALLHMTSSKWGCDRAQKDSGIPNASFRKLNVD